MMQQIFTLVPRLNPSLGFVTAQETQNTTNCQRAAEAKRPRLRGGSIIEPRVYLDVQGEKISSDPEKR